MSVWNLPLTGPLSPGMLHVAEFWMLVLYATERCNSGSSCAEVRTPAGTFKFAIFELWFSVLFTPESNGGFDNFCSTWFAVLPMGSELGASLTRCCKLGLSDPGIGADFTCGFGAWFGVAPYNLGAPNGPFWDATLWFLPWSTELTPLPRPLSEIWPLTCPL